MRWLRPEGTLVISVPLTLKSLLLLPVEFNNIFSRRNKSDFWSCHYKAAQIGSESTVI